MLSKEILTSFYTELLKPENRPTLNEKFEEIITGLYLNILESGNNAVDVGSYSGVHALKMAKKVGPNGKIYSFEPIPDAVKKQKKNIKRNSITNVSLYNLALSNFKGKSEFIFIKNSPGISGLKLMPHQRDEKKEILIVTVDLLDNIIPENNKVSFIKIDAEGGDFHVLQGATRIINNDRPIIAFECGSYLSAASLSYGYTKDEFFSFFKKTDYSLYSIIGIRLNPELWNARIPANCIGIPNEQVNKFLEIFWYVILNVMLNINLS